MKTQYNKGDTVWIYMSNHNGKKSKGEILEVLDLSEHGYGFLHYLIEVQTSIDPILEVREPFTMAETEDGPIGLFASLRKEFIKEKLNDSE